MKKQLSLDKVEILPLLLILKVYTSFIMGNSPYAIPYMGMFLYLIVPVISLIYRHKYFEKQTVSANSCFIILFLYFLLVALFDDFNYGKNTIYDIIFISIFFYMKTVFKWCTLRYFLNFFTVLLIFSIIEYILYVFFGIGYTFGTFDRGESSTNEQLVIQGIFNYYSLDSKDLFRFQSLFREPGYLGQCAVLVLFMWNKLDIKKSIVWLIAGLLSMSLFFYVMLVLAFLYNFFNVFWKKSRQRMKFSYLFLFAFFLCAGYLIIPNDYKSLITNRVEYISEENTDNRSTDTLNYELDRMFNSGEYILGIGAKSFYQKDMQWGNTGIKADLYKIGLFGVLFVILCFWLMIKDTPVKRSHRLFCLLLFCLFYYNGDIKYSLHINILLISFLIIGGENDFILNRSNTLKSGL